MKSKKTLEQRLSDAGVSSSINNDAMKIFNSNSRSSASTSVTLYGEQTTKANSKGATRSKSIAEVINISLNGLINLSNNNYLPRSPTICPALPSSNSSILRVKAYGVTNKQNSLKLSNSRNCSNNINGAVSSTLKFAHRQHKSPDYRRQRCRPYHQRKSNCGTKNSPNQKYVEQLNEVDNQSLETTLSVKRSYPNNVNGRHSPLLAYQCNNNGESNGCCNDRINYDRQGLTAIPTFEHSNIENIRLLSLQHNLIDTFHIPNREHTALFNCSEHRIESGNRSSKKMMANEEQEKTVKLSTSRNKTVNKLKCQLKRRFVGAPLPFVSQRISNNNNNNSELYCRPLSNHDCSLSSTRNFLLKDHLKPLKLVNNMPCESKRLVNEYRSATPSTKRRHSKIAPMTKQFCFYGNVNDGTSTVHLGSRNSELSDGSTARDSNYQSLYSDSSLSNTTSSAIIEQSPNCNSNCAKIEYLETIVDTNINGNDYINENMKRKTTDSNCVESDGRLYSNIFATVFKNLVFLDLYDNQIEKICNLDGLPSLTVLLLGKNRIKCLTGLRSLCDTLRVLDLHDNRITHLNDDNAIVFLYELRSLNLAGNCLEQINANDFKGLYKLNELNLKRNSVRFIDGFENLIALERLWLCHNEIRYIENISSIIKLSNIIEISIDHNPISITDNIYAFLISYLPNLQRLSQMYITDNARKSAIYWRQNQSNASNLKNTLDITRNINALQFESDVIDETTTTVAIQSTMVEKIAEQKNSQLTVVNVNLNKTQFDGTKLNSRPTTASIVTKYDNRKSIRRKRTVINRLLTNNCQSTSSNQSNRSFNVNSIDSNYSSDEEQSKESQSSNQNGKHIQSTLLAKCNSERTISTTNITLTVSECNSGNNAMRRASHLIGKSSNLLSEPSASSSPQAESSNSIAQNSIKWQNKLNSQILMMPTTLRTVSFPNDAILSARQNQCRNDFRPFISKTFAALIATSFSTAGAKTTKTFSTHNIDKKIYTIAGPKVCYKITGSQIMHPPFCHITKYPSDYNKHSMTITTFCNSYNHNNNNNNGSKEKLITSIEPQATVNGCYTNNSDTGTVATIQPETIISTSTTTTTTTSLMFNDNSPTTTTTTANYVKETNNDNKSKENTFETEMSKRTSKMDSNVVSVGAASNRQSDDYNFDKSQSIELSGQKLNITGANGLKFLDKPWDTDKTVNEVHTVHLISIEFNCIVSYFSRFKLHFPQLEHLVLRNTNLRYLGQLNALAELQGIKSLQIDQEGNAITLKSFWKSYAIYRLAHWGLQFLNNVQITTETIEAANRMFLGLTDFVLCVIPDQTITTLLNRFNLDENVQDRDRLTPKQWLLNTDNDFLRLIIVKEVLQWSKPNSSLNQNQRPSNDTLMNENSAMSLMNNSLLEDFHDTLAKKQKSHSTQHGLIEMATHSKTFDSSMVHVDNLNERGRLKLCEMIANACNVLEKLRVLRTLWPNILSDIVRNALIDYSQMHTYIRNRMTELMY